MSEQSLNQQIAKRRTFAIISHPDAGKTTITEKLILLGQLIQVAGTVKGKKNDKSATSDWMSLEKERGISVTSSVMQFPYRDRIVNLLDTPGHEDFSEDTYRTLTAADSAIMVCPSSAALTPESLINERTGQNESWAVCHDPIPDPSFNQFDRDRGLALLDESYWYAGYVFDDVNEDAPRAPISIIESESDEDGPAQIVYVMLEAIGGFFGGVVGEDVDVGAAAPVDGRGHREPRPGGGRHREDPSHGQAAVVHDLDVEGAVGRVVLQLIHREPRPADPEQAQLVAAQRQQPVEVAAEVQVGPVGVLTHDSGGRAVADPQHGRRLGLVQELLGHDPTLGHASIMP